MTYRPARAHAAARDLLTLTRSGQADRLANALVSAASPSSGPLMFQEVVARLAETFAEAIRDRRAALHVEEPFRLVLHDPAGRPVRAGELPPRIRVLARAVAAAVREDRDDCARLVHQACDTGAIQERIRLVAQSLVWTNDLLAADPAAYPPRLQCLHTNAHRPA